MGRPIAIIDSERFRDGGLVDVNGLRMRSVELSKDQPSRFVKLLDVRRHLRHAAAVVGHHLLFD